jgi:hypothetical protein
MIRVTRIAGESFDLENRREMPKALILTNGKREFSLYVDDETAAAVLEMMRDSPTQNVSMSTKVSEPVSKKAPEPVPVHTFEKPKDFQMAEVGGAAAEVEEDENSEVEPGEEYNDPATGAESL